LFGLVSGYTLATILAILSQLAVRDRVMDRGEVSPEAPTARLGKLTPIEFETIMRDAVALAAKTPGLN